MQSIIAASVKILSAAAKFYEKSHQNKIPTSRVMLKVAQGHSKWHDSTILTISLS